MYSYILSLSPDIINIPNSILANKLYDFNGKNPERDLGIILQKIELSLFYSTSVMEINNGTEEAPIIESIGDATNLFNTNEIGSDFKYFVSNKQNDINNEVLVDKAKNALSFLNDDPFVINWDIVFDKKNVDSISFILTIRTSGGNYQFTLDAARKTIT